MLASYCERAAAFRIDVPWAQAHRGAARAGPRGEGDVRRRRATRACARGSSGSRRARTRCTCACCSRATAPTTLCDELPAARASTQRPLRLPRRRAEPRRVARARAVARRARALDALERQTGQGELVRARAGWRASRYLERGRARATSRSTGRRARSRAARRSACRSPPRSARRSPARCSCSTSPPSACTPPTCRRSPSAMRELATRGQHRARHRARSARRSARADRVRRARARRGHARRQRSCFDGTPERAGEARRPAHRPGARGASSEPRATRRAAAERLARARRARATTSQDVDVDIPLGVLCAITGPSGSGKSTLARRHPLPRRSRGALGETRRRHARRARRARRASRRCASVDARRPVAARPHLARQRGHVHEGVGPRARALRRRARGARRAGSPPAHFSFNVAAGRCEACSGEGYETVEMQFLADVTLSARSARAGASSPRCSRVKHRGQERRRRARDDRRRGARSIFADDAARLVSTRCEPLSRARASATCRSASRSPRCPAARRSASSSRARSVERTRRARSSSSTSRARACTPTDVRAACSARCTRSSSAGASVRRGRARPRRSSRERRLGDRPRPGRRPRRRPAWWPRARRSSVARGEARRPAAALRGELARRARAPSAVRAPGKRGARPAHRACEHAREHNLQGRVAASIPHGKLTVVTGPSGSGKSSLAFDVVFAEGQRRFLETLTPYARQFLPTLPRPDVDRVDRRAAVDRARAAHHARGREQHRRDRHRGRPLPAAALRQARRACTARSDDAPIAASRRPTSCSRAAARACRRQGTRATRPAVRARKGTYLDVFTARGARRHRAARVDGAACRHRHAAEAREDQGAHHRSRRSYDGRARGARSRELFDRGARLGQGAVKVLRRARRRASAPLDARAPARRAASRVPELDPRWFSFNTKQGRCEACEGTGVAGRRRGACDRGRSARAVPQRARARASRPCRARVRLERRALPRAWCSSPSTARARAACER